MNINLESTFIAWLRSVAKKRGTGTYAAATIKSYVVALNEKFILKILESNDNFLPSVFHYQSADDFNPCGEYCKGFVNCDEPCVFLIGDTNRDGRINIADLTYLKLLVAKYRPDVFVNRPECWITPETRAEENPVPEARDLGMLKNFLTGKIRELTDN
ncbi:MAG: hypothetical protein FWH05_04425 [Oscillospiraceae bacterium]|nr:hypothetical protein [Oscillospiraceae bacterium]